MVSNASGGIDVYTWAGSSWLKVGEMTDGVGASSGQKKMHGGKEWDYVFEVDVADGAPKLMLPYNANGTVQVCCLEISDKSCRKSVCCRAEVLSPK